MQAPTVFEGATFIFTLGGIFWSFAKTSEQNAEHGRQLEKMWAWKDTHEKEDVQEHREFEKRLEIVNTTVVASSAQYTEVFKQVLGRLDKMETILEEIRRKQ